MKQKNTFNTYLLRYNKYLNKLKRLQLTGRNLRRQNILKKHIARLKQKLSFLLTQIKHARVATAMTITGLVAISNHAEAQTFGTVETNPFGLTTINDYNHLTFKDLDNDGDFDILAGDDSGDFRYFENTGTSAAPTFAAPVENPFGLTNIGTESVPAFVDLDNDGDFDILAGESVGSFFYFENTGTSAAPTFATVVENPFGLTNVGYEYSIPAFVDLDNDGDFDILAGAGDGDFDYFENTGTSAAPAFAALVENPFGLASLGEYSSPAFVDLDNDGDFDIISGEGYGGFFYLENTGTNAAPTFGAPQENLFNLSDIGYESAPIFVDIDDDGDADLFSGEGDGDFFYFENTTIVLSNDTVEANNTQLLIFPNPTSEILNISIAEHLNIKDISILDIIGKTVQKRTVTSNRNELSLNVSQLAKGVYTVKINTNTSTVTKKIVIK